MVFTKLINFLPSLLALLYFVGYQLVSTLQAKKRAQRIQILLTFTNKNLANKYARENGNYEQKIKLTKPVS